MMKLSDKDETILSCIMKEPRVLLADIPRKLKEADEKNAIPYPTVQRRVQQMIVEGILTRGYVIDYAKAGYIFRWRVGVLIDQITLQKPGKDDKYKYTTQIDLAHHIQRELPHLPEFQDKLIVNDVFVLLGGVADLTVDVFAKQDKIVTEFIINGLRNLRGVKDTSSAKLAYSSKYGWLGQNGGERESDNKEDDIESAKSS